MKEFTKADGELVVLEEYAKGTQKLLRQWLSTNYSITILKQVTNVDGQLVTTLIRKKLD